MSSDNDMPPTMWLFEAGFMTVREEALKPGCAWEKTAIGETVFKTELEARERLQREIQASLFLDTRERSRALSTVRRLETAIADAATKLTENTERLAEIKERDS